MATDRPIQPRHRGQEIIRRTIQRYGARRSIHLDCHNIEVQQFFEISNLSRTWYSYSDRLVFVSPNNFARSSLPFDGPPALHAHRSKHEGLRLSKYIGRSAWKQNTRKATFELRQQSGEALPQCLSTQNPGVSRTASKPLSQSIEWSHCIKDLLR